MQGAWVQYLVRELDPTCSNLSLVQSKKKKSPELVLYPQMMELQEWSVLCCSPHAGLGIANPVLPQWLLRVEWFWHREEKNEDVGSNIPVVLYLVEQKFKTSPVLEKSVPKMKPAQKKAAWSRVRLLWSFELHHWAFLHLLISLLVS